MERMVIWWFMIQKPTHFYNTISYNINFTLFVFIVQGLKSLDKKDEVLKLGWYELCLEWIVCGQLQIWSHIPVVLNKYRDDDYRWRDRGLRDPFILFNSSKYERISRHLSDLYLPLLLLLNNPILFIFNLFVLFLEIFFEFATIIIMFEIV